MWYVVFQCLFIIPMILKQLDDCIYQISTYKNEINHHTHTKLICKNLLKSHTNIRQVKMNIFAQHYMPMSLATLLSLKFKNVTKSRML